MGRITESITKSWWAVSALVALGAMALTTLALLVPWWPVTAVLLVGAAVFVLALRLHPDYWHRRMASGALGSACASGLVPNLSIDFLSESAFAKFVVDSGYVPTIVLGVLTVVFAVLDFFHQRARRETRTPAPDAPPHATPANIHTEGDHSPAAGRDQTSARDGGVVVKVEEGGHVELHMATLPRVGPLPVLPDALAPTVVPEVPDASLLAPDAADATGPPKPAPPPAPPICKGRDNEVAELVAALDIGAPLPVVLLGPGGVGKTTVAETALHDARIAARYARRLFAHCDGATTVDMLVSEIGARLGMPALARKREAVLAELQRAATLLVLDNFETTWSADEGGTRPLIGELAAAPTALVLTVRGEQAPHVNIEWHPPIRVEPVVADAATQVFHAHAQRSFDGDPDLANVVALADGLPLVLALLGHQAQVCDNLAQLMTRWNSRKTALLDSGEGRTTNFAVSVELSINDPRMGEADSTARRLLSLSGQLPDGLCDEDLEGLLGPDGQEAAACLRKVGLTAPGGASGRLRLLAPVRAYIADVHPPDAADEARLTAHFLKLARDRGEQVGGKDGGAAAERLPAEMGNLTILIERALEGTDPRKAIDAAIGLGQFMRFSGVGNIALLEESMRQAERLADELRQARVAELRGKIALTRSQYNVARAWFEAALPLYRRVADVLGEAICLFGMGDVALRRAQHETGRDRFEEALALYRRIRVVLGEANCIFRLGDIALGCSQHNEARDQYATALLLYRRTEDILGEANCVARLGHIALEDLDHDTARSRFTEAEPLYHRAGQVLGEANCVLGLGDVAVSVRDTREAGNRYEAALAMYERILDPYSIGSAHQRLARLSDGPKRDEHLQRAREAWASIDRDDLIEGLDMEFGGDG